MAISSAPGDVVLVGEETRFRRWSAAVRDFCVGRPLGAIGAAIVVVMLVVAALAGLLAPYDPVTVDFAAMLSKPSSQHWLGTAAFCRDVLSPPISGSRTPRSVWFAA